MSRMLRYTVLVSPALVVATLGATPLGQASGRVVSTTPPFARRAGYATTAGNALALNGHRASTSGGPGTVPVFDSRGKLPGTIVDTSGLLGPVRTAMRAETVPAFQRTSVTVDCPDPYLAVVGGGARVDSATGSSALVVDGTAPGDSGRGWVTDVSNQGDTDLTVDFFALCAKERPQ